MPKNTPFIFFIHIPKTAGSSFLSILQRRFNNRFLGVYSNIHDEPPFTKHQLETFVADYGEKYDCLGSHRLSADFPLLVGDRECLGISFIRDPFDLFVSHYYYHRFHSAGFGKARELDLEEYFEYAVVDNNYPHYKNWQSNLLCGVHQGTPSKSFSELCSLIEENHLLLFPTKRFDQACLILSRHLPDAFSQVWYTRKNVSKKDQVVPEGLRERFSIYAEKDLELLKLAERQTQLLQKKHFPTEESLNKAMLEFKPRCRRKFWTNLPSAALRRILRGIYEKI